MIRGQNGELILTKLELLNRRHPITEESYAPDTHLNYHQFMCDYSATIDTVPEGVNFFIPGDPQVYQLIPNST